MVTSRGLARETKSIVMQDAVVRKTPEIEAAALGGRIDRVPQVHAHDQIVLVDQLPMAVTQQAGGVADDRDAPALEQRQHRRKLPAGAAVGQPALPRKPHRAWPAGGRMRSNIAAMRLRISTR